MLVKVPFKPTYRQRIKLFLKTTAKQRMYITENVSIHHHHLSRANLLALRVPLQYRED